MHDAIELERHGKPTALVCTQPFIPTARAIARVQGIPNYPFVALPHPLTSLDDAALTQRAREALPTVLSLLLAK